MRRLGFCAFVWLVLLCATSPRPASHAARQAPAAAQVRLPLLFWEQSIESAPVLKKAGIERIAVPPAQVKAWRKAGFQPVPLTLAQLQAREKLLTPRLAGRAQVASATSRPWIDANGWRFQRHPQGKFYYEVPTGKAVLAAAEAFAYSADVVLQITAEDLNNEVTLLGLFLAFLQQLPSANLPPVADIGVVDDNSPDLGEVLNLLGRRNLLYRLSKTPIPALPLNIKLGSPEFPAEAAANPSEFALRVRRQLTDERRSLRLYGTESVICFLLSDGQRARVHLLNYSGRALAGLRLRVRGRFTQGTVAAFGVNQTGLEEFMTDSEGTEFSLGQMGVYTVVDLSNK